jgi:UDP-glucose 4-epimerase
LHRRLDGLKAELVDGDILDREKLIDALKGVDAVIHLAAKKAVGESVTNPLKYYENNVGGTLNLLAGMSLHGIKHLVFSSSAAVYSPSEKDAIGEDDLSEQLIEKVSAAEGISAISLRYFNVVGSGSDNLGDNARDNLVPKVFLALKTGGTPEIFGTDYPTPDGTCIRDYIHVQDLAEAHIRALKKVESTNTIAAYNVGSGNGYSVKEIFAEMERATGRKIEPRLSPRRAGDPPKLIACTKKIESELGWKPSKNLAEMISSAWRAEQVAK